jgi:hypothetical protein
MCFISVKKLNMQQKRIVPNSGTILFNFRLVIRFILFIQTISPILPELFRLLPA